MRSKWSDRTRGKALIVSVVGLNNICVNYRSTEGARGSNILLPLLFFQVLSFLFLSALFFSQPTYHLPSPYMLTPLLSPRRLCSALSLLSSVQVLSFCFLSFPAFFFFLLKLSLLY